MQKTRRELIAGATALAGLAAVPEAWAGRLLESIPRIGPGAFADGVASGDPGATAVTFWGRLTTERPRSGARLIVAEDAGLRRVVATTVVPTGEAMDHCLKARVGGLTPGTIYHYAWESGDGISPVGRTRTANHPDAGDPVRIAASSCQRLVAGFYTGHAHAAAQPPYDLVMFLGDYTYETEANGVRRDPLHSNDLASYREKLRIYRQDPALRELHRLHPSAHIWDDHEVANNYTDNQPAPSELQRAAAYRASFEWMPRMTFPRDRYRTYKPLPLGRRAEVILLDERQYRTGGGDRDDKGYRPFLGRAQMDFLKDRLKRSQAQWKVLGNQLPVFPINGIAQPADLQNDQWDGYQAERTELLGFIEEQKLTGVVFVTGDIHTFIASELNKDFERLDARAAPSVAVDYVCGSVTSSGFPRESEGAVLASSPHIKQFNGSDHGYGSLDLDEKRLVTEYRAGPIDKPEGVVRTIERFTQAAGTATFTRESNPRQAAAAAAVARSAAASAGAAVRADRSKAARERRRAIARETRRAS